MSDAMMSYVANFVRTGKPNIPGDSKPNWESWSNRIGGPKTMLFDVDGDVAVLEMSDIEDTFDSVLLRMAADLEGPIYVETLEYLNQRRQEKDE